MDCANENQPPFHPNIKSGAGQPPPPKSIEIGLEENFGIPATGTTTGARRKLSHHVKRWSSAADKGVRRSQENDIVVEALTLHRCSWIGRYFTFYRLHAAYFVIVGSLGTLGMYVLPLTNSRRLSFVDAMYTAFSAVCGTGLQTVRSQDLTQFHNYVILVLMNLGAPVLISLLPLCARRLCFHLCIKQYNHHLWDQKCLTSSPTNNPVRLELDCDGDLEQDLKHVEVPPLADANHSRIEVLIDAMERDVKHVSDMADYHTQYVDSGNQCEKWRTFVDAKQALRTLEYRALVALSWLVIRFFIGGQILGFILGAIYLLGSPHDAAIVRGKDINPTFYAFFSAVSTFTNAGYNVNNDSMLAFQKSTLLLILYTVLASLGNTMYAPFLRLLVWIQFRVVGEKDKAVYEYLLCHPRRCFTNLFPWSQTMWLVVIFAAFTSFQLILLCILEWNGALDGMNTLEKLIAGLYQTVGTRNAGGTVVNLYHLTPALLFIFVVMMYISAYPLFLSRQTSDDNYDDTDLVVSQNYKERMNPDKWESILVVQSRSLLARDTSYLFFAVLFLCLSENRSITSDPLNFSIFNIVFEVISAYGSIGLSMGYSCDLQIDKSGPCNEVPYSFSGTWTSSGKLILVIVMFFGRHRGLPDNIDSAIRLPTKLSAPAPGLTPERRCEEYVTEVELRMRPQLQLAQGASPDFTRQWTAVRSFSRFENRADT